MVKLIPGNKYLFSNKYYQMFNEIITALDEEMFQFQNQFIMNDKNSPMTWRVTAEEPNDVIIIPTKLHYLFYL